MDNIPTMKNMIRLMLLRPQNLMHPRGIVCTQRWSAMRFTLKADIFQTDSFQTATVLVLIDGTTAESLVPSFCHPGITGIWRASGKVHASRLQLHDKQQIKRDQPAFGPDLDGGEVDSCQHVPVGIQKCAPRGLSLPHIEDIVCGTIAKRLQVRGEDGYYGKTISRRVYTVHLGNPVRSFDERRHVFLRLSFRSDAVGVNCRDRRRL